MRKRPPFLPGIWQPVSKELLQLRLQEEFNSHKVDFLEKKGFTVERGYGGLDTARLGGGIQIEEGVQLGDGVPKAGVGSPHRPEGIDVDPPTKGGGDWGHMTGDRATKTRSPCQKKSKLFFFCYRTTSSYKNRSSQWF